MIGQELENKGYKWQIRCDICIQVCMATMFLFRSLCEGVADVWGEEGGEEEDPGIQVQS